MNLTKKRGGQVTAVYKPESQETSHSTQKNSGDEKEITYDKMFVLFLVGSVIGVLMEGFFCLLTKGHWETHVVSVFGAFNILYGAGAVLFFVGAVKLKSKPLGWRVVIMAVSATTLELFSGLLLKDFLGMRAWNYEHSFMNYKGLICIGFTCVWGLTAASITRWSERHYGMAAKTKIQFDLDEDAPDDWMQARFIEWEFLDNK
ncbi:MAG: putative ABC transporter permease [Ruminococcus sp.]|nr:putative ABC transporter permease [Ruminococcus sp.]MDY3894732.1 putative ABC transporter permease [Candidatus Fimenecus sp.]